MQHVNTIIKTTHLQHREFIFTGSSGSSLFLLYSYYRSSHQIRKTSDTVSRPRYHL